MNHLLCSGKLLLQYQVHRCKDSSTYRLFTPISFRNSPGFSTSDYNTAVAAVFRFRLLTLGSRNLFWCFPEVANGFSCPAPGEVSNAGSFSRHAHPEDCRKYYICMEGVAREYGCPIGTVFKIGDADGTGNCEDPEDVPGW